MGHDSIYTYSGGIGPYLLEVYVNPCML